MQFEEVLFCFGSQMKAGSYLPALIRSSSYCKFMRESAGFELLKLVTSILTDFERDGLARHLTHEAINFAKIRNANLTSSFSEYKILKFYYQFLFPRSSPRILEHIRDFFFKSLKTPQLFQILTLMFSLQ